MATNQNLRTPESTLKQSRLDFINKLAEREAFESECQVIIPELIARWNTKIVVPFDLDTTNPENQIVFKHYLYNYTPQLLVHGINRLASRLARKQEAGQLPVESVKEYFKNIVQQLRREEIAKATAPVAVADGYEQ